MVFFVPAMFAPPVSDPSAPSAPPASMFDNVPGYEGTMMGGGELSVSHLAIMSEYDNLIHFVLE